MPSFWALRVREQHSHPTEVESFAFAGIRPNVTRPYNWENMRTLGNIKADSAGLVHVKNEDGRTLLIIVIPWKDTYISKDRLIN